MIPSMLDGIFARSHSANLEASSLISRLLGTSTSETVIWNKWDDQRDQLARYLQLQKIMAGEDWPTIRMKDWNLATSLDHHLVI